jgi:hypothetical protein
MLNTITTGAHHLILFWVHIATAYVSDVYFNMFCQSYFDLTFELNQQVLYCYPLFHLSLASELTSVTVNWKKLIISIGHRSSCTNFWNKWNFLSQIISKCSSAAAVITWRFFFSVPVFLPVCGLGSTVRHWYWIWEITGHWWAEIHSVERS